MEWLHRLLEDPLWSPYAVGIGIGLLSWLTFLLSDHPLGVSTTFAKGAGMLERLVRGPKVLEKAYYREHEPAIDWQWMLVVGLFAGALAAAGLADSIRWQWVPPLWSDRFGGAEMPRLATALLGGICVGFGSRWGCGCTSGHGISGALQLVLGSWLAAICSFVGGIGAAFFLYRLI